MRSISVKIFVSFLAFVLIGSWVACNRNETIAVEPVKDIGGTWKIDKITRNGEDLTDWIDTREFQLIFQQDSAYTGMGGSYKTLEGLPFVGESNQGLWKFNNAAYPVYIYFTPEGTTTPIQVKFFYPVVTGKREISLTISPGCPSNSYEYLLKKVSK